MLVLGIDPGLGTTGYGLVRVEKGEGEFVECGVVRTPPGGEVPARLLQIYDDLSGIIQRAKPDRAAIEILFYSRNVSTAVDVAQARGAAVLACAKAGLPVYEYHPTKVKRALAGYGHARKDQMQRMVQMLLRLDEPPKPDDAADAVAIALLHAYDLHGLAAKKVKA